MAKLDTTLRQLTRTEAVLISDLFGALLQCDKCRHGVGVHDVEGCLERECTCKKTKDGVVQTNVALSIAEHAVEWQPTSA